MIKAGIFRTRVANVIVTGMNSSANACIAMANPDPYLARIEAFNTKNGGGVTITKVRNGYTLHLTATGAPIARLQPTGLDDEVRVKFWSYKDRWQDVGDFGGIILPLEKALEEISKNEIFWTWT